MIKYSIIVPVYNCERYLPICVNSVLAQTGHVSYELILVDDGSTDSSSSICDDYADKNEHIRVIHQKNMGASRARNAGIKAAEGEYVLFLDSDDIWEPELLFTLEKRIAEASVQLDLVVYAHYGYWRSGEKKPNLLHVCPEGERGVDYLDALFSCGQTPPATLWSYAYRRKFMLDNNLFLREELLVAEDSEQTMRAVPLAQYISGINTPLYNNRADSPGSLTKIASPRKVMCKLTVKQEIYRRYPNAVTANEFFRQIIEVATLTHEDARDAVEFVWENKDIMRHAHGVARRLIRVMFETIGIYPSACVVLPIIRLRYRLSDYCALRNGKSE